MEQYIWLAAIFMAASLSYWAGVVLGRNEADNPPTENAYIRSREIVAQANIEIAKYDIDKNLEIEKYKVDHGVYDQWLEEDWDGEEDGKDDGED